MGENIIPESEQLLKRTLDSLCDAVLVITADTTRIIECNPAVTEIFGYSRDEVIGKTVEFLHVSPVTLDMFKKQLHDVVENQDYLSRREYEMNRKDGTVFPTEHSVVSLEDKNGNRIGWVSVLRDITQRKLTEQALKESEEKYRKQFETSLDAIVIADEQTGEILDANQAACDMTGRDQSELIGQSQKILHPLHEHDGDFSRTFKKHSEAVEGKSLQAQVITKDGVIRDVEINATRFELKDRTVLQGIFHDITVRTQIEAARSDFERTVSTISSLFVGVYDINSAINDCLQHIGRLSRASRTYLFLIRDGGAILDNTHEWCADEVEPQKEQLQNQPCEMFPWWMEKLRNREIININDLSMLPPEAKMEREFLENQGIISLISLPVYIRGELAGFLGCDYIHQGKVWSDYDLALLRISAEIIGNALERERAEEDNLLREERLLQVQKMEAIGNLAGGVAHDFNNLLTTIKGYGEMLLNELHPDDPRHMNAKEILKAAHRASLFTRQLLAFSRRQMLQPQTLDLNMVITNIEKMLKPMIGETVQMVTVLDPDLRKVLVDQGQMEQVIMNLAVNARDAMSEGGGRLTIRTESITLTETQCSRLPEARPGDFVCLSVADSGIGMHKEIMQHIFEPFFTTKKVGKGTGIGLSVIYGIIKQHKGWINVFSRPGLGTTFKVFLPAFSGETTTEPFFETIPVQQLLGQGERILCVEDEEGVRHFAVDALSKNGYLVFPASTAQEAIDIFNSEQGNFTMVFSDVVLPDINGVELVDKLCEEKPELKILMTSGYTGEQLQSETIQKKGYRFLPKPYALPDLLQTIRAVIESNQKN